MVDDSKVHVRVEDFSAEIRSFYERTYQIDPVRTHNTLVACGYWLAAAQLRIDHAVGRLAPLTVSL